MDLGTILKFEVNSIVKFINRIYSPKNFRVIHYDDPERYSIIFYFDNIDDKYISNRQAKNIRDHKENMLTREIRSYIENYLGIKTQGLRTSDFLPPVESFPISIFVKHTK